MTEPITKQELIDASADAQTLEDVVNGNDTTDVTSRLARTYPTLAKALRLIVQNGLLGATAFNLRSQMLASALVDNDYAVVTDDPVSTNNGFYQKRGGVFEFLAWNPINQFLTALAAETSARAAGDAANATAISTEQSTRTGQVATLTAQISAESTARTAADTTLQNNINAEQTARIAADSANSTAIAAETTARQAAITAEQSARATAITAESTARQAADAAISAELDAETASRISADNVLQSQITAEAVARAAADSTNAAAIATESSTRAAAVTALQTSLAAEQSARIAADNTLQTNINAVQSNLTAESATRASADTANATAITAEQTARAAAVTDLQAQIDDADAAIFAEVSERKSVIDSNPDDSKRGIELTRDGFIVAQILEGLFNVARLPVIRDAAGVAEVLQNGSVVGRISDLVEWAGVLLGGGKVEFGGLSLSRAGAGLQIEYDGDVVFNSANSLEKNAPVATLGGVTLENQSVKFDDLTLSENQARSILITADGFLLFDSANLTVEQLPAPEDPPLDTSKPLFGNLICGWAGDLIRLSVPDLTPHRVEQDKKRPILVTIASRTTGYTRSGRDHILFDPALLSNPARIVLRDTRQAALRTVQDFQVAVAPAGGGQAPNILMIGDSIIHGSAAPNILEPILVAKGYAPAWIGTMTASSTRRHEGHSGINTSQFVARDLARFQPVPVGGEAAYLALANRNEFNPCIRLAQAGDPPEKVFNGYIFDAAFYQTRFGLATPDVVLIALGTNNIRDQNEPALSSNFYADLNIMLDSCRSAWPAARVLLTLTPTAASADRNALWPKYIAVIEQLKAVTADRADPQIKLLPAWAHVNNEAGYPLGSGAADKLGAITVGLSDSIHPAQSSRAELWQTMSAYLACAAKNYV